MRVALIGGLPAWVAPTWRSGGHAVVPAVDGAADVIVVAGAAATGIADLRRRYPTAWIVAVTDGACDAEALTRAGVDDLWADDLAIGCRVVRRGAVEQQVRARVTAEVDLEWRTALDRMPIAVAMIDGAGCFVRMNASARALLGARHDELIGTPIARVAGHEPWATAVQLIEAGAGDRDAGATRSTSDGDGRSWEVSARPANRATGDRGRILVTSRDVTDHARLHRAAEANARMASVGALVAGVAHEVRNPLFGISAIADALEARMREQPQSLPHFAMLRSVVARLTRIMNDLLSMSTATALDRERNHVVEILHDARAHCAHLAAEAQVEIDVTSSDGVPRVEVDRARLTQVFVNLFDNALRHAPPDSRVEAHVGLSASGRRLRCTVRDRGRGFGALGDRAFEPFVTQRAGGVGLGLSIVRQIVERHAGTVEVTDNPSGGALVAVELPLEGS